MVNHAEVETLFVAPELSALVAGLRTRGELPSLLRVIAIGAAGAALEGMRIDRGPRRRRARTIRT